MTIQPPILKTKPSRTCLEDDQMTFFRAVADLVRQEVGKLRGQSFTETLTPDTRLDSGHEGHPGLALKSLNLMDVATSVSDMFHIGKAGLDDLLLARRTLGDWAEIAVQAQSILLAGDTPDEGIGFRTSGTTGRPKLVKHSMNRLLEEVDFWADMFANHKRIVSAVPGHHIYGFLFTCLLPSKLGAEVLDVRYSMPGATIAALREGDLIIGQPDFWQRMLDTVSRQDLALPQGLSGVTSTAPMPPSSGRQLVEQGMEKLIEVYGSTETLGIGWRDLSETSFSLLPLWKREGGGIRHATEKFIAPVQDRLVWHDDIQFSISGRLDGMVQIGSKNLCISSMEQAASMIEGVRSASIRVEQRETGQRLIADIEVADPDISHTVHASVQEALAPHLENCCEPEIRFQPASDH